MLGTDLDQKLFETLVIFQKDNDCMKSYFFKESADVK